MVTAEHDLAGITHYWIRYSNDIIQLFKEKQ